MKKRYLIVFLFLIFCNINVVKAEILWFERNAYDVGTEDYKFEDLIYDMCKGNFTCSVVCSNSPEYIETGSGEGLKIEENVNIIYYAKARGGTCSSIDSSRGPESDEDIEAFFIRNGSLEETFDAIKYNTCNGERCIDYILNSGYCTDVTESNSQYKLCTELKNAEENDNSDGSCDYAWKPMSADNNSYLDEIIFRITLDKDITTIVNISFSDMDDFTTLLLFNALLSGEVEYHTDLLNILYFYGKGGSYKEFEENFIENYKGNNYSCPRLYIGANFDVKNYFSIVRKEWYIEFDSDSFNEDRYAYVLYQRTFDSKIELLDARNSSLDTEIIDINTPSTIESCEDLFGDSSELQELLATIIKVVKIAIPIILIGLGTLDFAKSIFESSEENMKKAQAKFIKRIIIGICIFLIPTVLKILLEIANSIWGNISTDFCGLL